jgi:hypothetical protein
MPANPTPPRIDPVKKEEAPERVDRHLDNMTGSPQPKS